jgi:hypothetical protein
MLDCGYCDKLQSLSFFRAPGPSKDSHRSRTFTKRVVNSRTYNVIVPLDVLNAVPFQLPAVHKR